MTDASPPQPQATTPEAALALLVEGNARYVANTPHERDFSAGRHSRTRSVLARQTAPGRLTSTYHRLEGRGGLRAHLRGDLGFLLRALGTDLIALRRAGLARLGEDRLVLGERFRRRFDRWNGSANARTHAYRKCGMTCSAIVRMLSRISSCG